MTPQSFLEQARDLDLDIRFIDALLDRAAIEHADRKIVLRLLQRRAECGQAWGKLWETRPVEMAK